MLSYTDLSGRRIDKVQTAVDRLRAFEPPDGYFLAFSGGKDSICIKALADMAGVKYDAHYSVTTVDPPELTRFIKKYHPDVIWDKPDLPMRKLIVKKQIPPTRIARYCCEVLKEGGGRGRIVVTGVRWAESNRRKNSHGIASVTGKTRIILNDDNDESRRTVEQCYRTNKTMVNPIVDWLDEDVWQFIRENNLAYCELYDQGFKRLGCVGCPLGGRKQMEREFCRWPQYEALYLKAFSEMLKERAGKGKANGKWTDEQAVFDWWLGKNGKAPAKNQTEMREARDD